MTEAAPKCWIIAGPNGAGKTTFALQYLPQVANCRRFVNADAIAAGLSPLAPETALLVASRLLLKEIEKHIQQGANREIVNPKLFTQLIQQAEQ
jgi:predicted ABC-type ATPase